MFKLVFYKATGSQPKVYNMLYINTLTILSSSFLLYSTVVLTPFFIVSVGWGRAGRSGSPMVKKQCVLSCNSNWLIEPYQYKIGLTLFLESVLTICTYSSEYWLTLPVCWFKCRVITHDPTKYNCELCCTI